MIQSVIGASLQQRILVVVLALGLIAAGARAVHL